MKNMKKNSLFFGAFLVALLMVSGTSIGTMTQQNDISKLGISSVSCVKSGIYLSGSYQRKILSDSLCHIGNPDARVLVQAVITEMDSKGFVNSYDIEQIVNEYDLEFGIIAGSGASITTGAYPNPGYAMRVGHPFQNSGTIVFGLLFWNAKHSLNPVREINITITLAGAQQHIVDDKIGLCVGFSGTFSRGEEETGKWFTIHGSALLYLV